MDQQGRSKLLLEAKDIVEDRYSLVKKTCNLCSAGVVGCGDDGFDRGEGNNCDDGSGLVWIWQYIMQCSNSNSTVMNQGWCL